MLDQINWFWFLSGQNQIKTYEARTKAKTSIMEYKDGRWITSKIYKKIAKFQRKMFKYRHVFNHPQILTRCKMFTRTVFEMFLERKIGISLPSQVLNNCFNPCIWKRENICKVSNFQVFKTKAVIFNFPCGLASPQWINAKKHFCQLYLPFKKIR